MHHTEPSMFLAEHEGHSVVGFANGGPERERRENFGCVTATVLPRGEQAS